MTISVAPVVVRHDLGRTVAVVVWLGSVVALAATWSPGPAALLGAVGLSGVVWALAWRPAVVVDDDAVTVRNPLRDVRIGWAGLEDAGFDWSLWLRAGTVTCRAAAAPGPASMGALYDRSRSAGGVYERRAVAQVGQTLPPALLAVRQRWSARARGSSAEVTVTRAWTSVVVLALSVASMAGAVLLA